MAESSGVAALASLCGDFVVACTDSRMPSSHIASTFAGSSLKRRLITVWVLFRSVRLCTCSTSEGYSFCTCTTDTLLGWGLRSTGWPGAYMGWLIMLTNKG